MYFVQRIGWGLLILVLILLVSDQGGQIAHSHTASPIIGDDGTVYIGSYDDNLYALE